MGVKAWLEVAGVLGAAYLIKNSEWALFKANDYPMEGQYDYENNRYFTCREVAQNWINMGVGLSDANSVVAAFKDVINSFNDFMDDMVLHKEDLARDAYAEWLFEDTATGIKKLKNISFTFPNGCVIVIVDSEAVMNFRIDPALTDWYGFWIPLAGDDEDGSHLAMRLMREPRWEFIIAGSENWLYIDPLDGVVKPGTDCTPVQSTTDTHLLYFINWVAFFLFICDILRSLGLFKTLNAWWQKRILRQQFSRIRNMIENVDGMVADLHSELDENTDLQDTFYKEWVGNTTLVSGNFDLIKNAINDEMKKLRKSMYKPYG